jgi:hypothetical protein
MNTNWLVVPRKELNDGREKHITLRDMPVSGTNTQIIAFACTVISKSGELKEATGLLWRLLRF